MSARVLSVLVADKMLEDKETGLWSAITLIDRVTTDTAGQIISAESFFTLLFDDADIGSSFEFRSILEDGTTGKIVHNSGEAKLPIPTRRVNVRVRGIQVPEPGQYLVRGQVRQPDGEWLSSEAAWSFEIEPAQANSGTASS